MKKTELTGKRVLLLSGSPRKKNTWNALASVSDIIQAEGAEAEMIRITDFQIQDCLGCESCVKGRVCPLKDDMPLLMDKMKKADGIILASPVYMCQVSSHLKRFLDRTPHWFHRPELVGKPSFALVTTAGSYQKDSLKYMSNVLMHWGTLFAGSAARKAKSWYKPVTADELAPFLKHLSENGKNYRPSLRNLILFKVQKVLSEKILPVDRAFWEEKGWLGAPFFVPVKISPGRKIFARMFYRMLKSRVKPYQEID